MHFKKCSMIKINKEYISSWGNLHYAMLLLLTLISYSINHAAAFVGYRTENGTDYLIVRNSWGITWGDKGYYRIQREINIGRLMSIFFLLDWLISL